MRGVVIREFGPIDTHRLEEVADPAPGADEVLIDIHAIGLNYPDTLMMQGRYQVKPETPFVPGRDAAGTLSRPSGPMSATSSRETVSRPSIPSAPTPNGAWFRRSDAGRCRTRSISSPAPG